MFTRAKPSGWSFGERLLSSQMNHVDANVANALDGLNGGTYTLLAALILGGAEFRVSGSLFRSTATANLEGAQTNVFGTLNASGIGGVNISNGLTVGGESGFAGTATFNGNVVLGSNSSDSLTVNAITTFSSPVTFNADANYADLTVSGDILLGNSSFDTLTVSATGFFTSPVTFNVGAIFTGTATFNGALAANGAIDLGNASADALTVTATSTFNSPVTLADPVTLSGDGHVRVRVHSHILGDDLTIGVNTADVVRIESGSQSGNGTLTLLTTGASTGSQILIFTEETTYTMTHAAAGALRSASGNVAWALMTFVGGSWVRTAYYVVP